jgi:hypothetical protein
MAFWDFEEEISVIEKNKTESIEVKWAQKDGRQYIVQSVIRKNRDDDGFSHTGKTVAMPVDKFLSINDAILNKLNEKTSATKE